MVYISGDTHGFYHDFLKRLADNEVEPDSTVIITGDFGFTARPDDRDKQAAFLKLKKLPFQFCFADGNHEQFDVIYQCPVIEWCGGKVHKIADNIYHLCRGEFYVIEGKSYFILGGAYSIDKIFRCAGRTWFEQEQPSAEEYEHANRMLEKHNYTMDYVVTHTAPYSVIQTLGFSLFKEEAELDSYLERLKDCATYKRWFFGHYHMDKSLLRGKFTVVHEKMIRIE